MEKLLKFLFSFPTILSGFIKLNTVKKKKKTITSVNFIVRHRVRKIQEKWKIIEIGKAHMNY